MRLKPALARPFRGREKLSLHSLPHGEEGKTNHEHREPKDPSQGTRQEKYAEERRKERCGVPDAKEDSSLCQLNFFIRLQMRADFPNEWRLAE
jgi:hypothetical protein